MSIEATVNPAEINVTVAAQTLDVNTDTQIIHDWRPILPVDWMGVDPEFVKNVYDKQYKLSETGFATWEAATSAGVIVASETLDEKYAADMATYEYLLLWKFDADIKYAAGTTQKAIPLREIQVHVQEIFKRPSNRDNIEANVYDGNTCITGFSAPFLLYRNSSGTLTYTWAATYGIYSTIVAASFSNATSDTPNITIKTPSVSARCNSSYFATARAANVDQENSKFRIIGDLYRVKKGTFARDLNKDVVDIYNHSIIQ